MKTSNKYIVLAAMALTFAACTQEDDFTPQTDGDAVKINATIGKLQTRVAYGDDGTTNFINGDKICVQNILRESKNIATYTFDGNTWTTTDALAWNGGTAESQFQAWYPATASFDKFTLPTDQNSIEELPAADWMTASTSAMVKPDDNTINLAFEHKLAKITVQITEFTSQFGDDPDLMAATIYSLSDEYVTVNGGIQPVLRGNAATAIVCPGRYAVGTNLMEIRIFDAGHETYHEVPVNAFLTDTGLEAGKHYTFSLKVGKDAISINKVNVVPWTTKEIDGGMAEEVEPQTYEYDAATNTYAVFSGEYLQVAIDEAEVTGTAENPAIVKLMDDIESMGALNEYGLVEQDVLVDNGVITLDLNGYTLTGMSGHTVIKVTNGASLAIDDSSENKSGNVVGLANDEYYIYALNVDGGNLVVNNGNFEGRRAVWGYEGASILINGGTFKATYNAVEARESSSLTITGGTFISDEYALCLATAATVMGGTFIGGKHDISTTLTKIFTYNEDGVGPTFPGGLSTNDSNVLNAFLADGAGYYVNDELQTLAENARSCEGDVTVKRIPATE